MTQRQNKILCTKKGKKNKEDEISRKPIVFSYDDTDKMATESSKAKIDFTSKNRENAREFSSYFYGQKKNTEPFYVATSHEGKTPVSKQNRVIAMYPTLVHGLRWSPSVESYGEEYEEEEQKYLCRNCQNQSYEPDWRDNMRYKDNIRRFVDNSTMTPRLHDVACGACSPQPQTSYTSTVSISSDIATRDVSNTQVRYPSRVLQTRNYESNLNYKYYERKSPEVIPETDYLDDSEGRSYPPRRTKLPVSRKTAITSDECERPRKILYNEGISDIVANNFSNYCAYAYGTQGPIKQTRNYAKTSDFSRGIPFDHRKQSKYHYECKEQDFKSYRCDIEEEVKHLVAKPKVLKYCQARKPAKCDGLIKMPKKVLSSERNIDSYIRSSRPNFFK